MELTIDFGVEVENSREWVIIRDKNLYGLKYAGLEWFEKLKEGLKVTDSVHSKVDPFLWYKEIMVLLFYVHDCLMFSSSEYKVDELYAYLQEGLKI